MAIGSHSAPTAARRLDAAPVAARETPAIRALATYARLPLAFVENQGQTDARVRYYAQGSRAAFYLTRRAIVMSFLNDADASTAGNAYIAGQTKSSDYPTTGGAFDRTINGMFDAFVAKLTASGSALVYSSYLGGAAVDFGSHVAVDAGGSAYILGSTSSPAFPTTPGAFDTTANAGFDIFVAKMNPVGSALVYSTYLGGRASDGAGALVLDAAGDAYIAGGTSSADFPTTPGTFDPVVDGNDGFVLELNAAGSALVYCTTLGGSGIDGVNALARDADGRVRVTGTTSSLDFPVTPDAFAAAHGAGTTDAFIAALGADDAAILFDPRRPWRAR